MFSRAKLKLVIVCNEVDVERFIPREQFSNSNGIMIKVLGKFGFLYKEMISSGSM